MYRDIVAVAKSFYRLTLVDAYLRLFWFVGRLSGPMTMMINETFGSLCSRVPRLDSELTVGVLLAAVATKTYLDARRRGFEISALRYEDLVARPLDMCRVVLEYCHLPVSLAELAVTALDVDSQRNSVVAKSQIGHFKEPELTPHTKTKLNELLKQFGIPLASQASLKALSVAVNHLKTLTVDVLYFLLHAQQQYIIYFLNMLVKDIALVVIRTLHPGQRGM